jgi:hypothetical protein
LEESPWNFNAGNIVGFRLVEFTAPLDKTSELAA